MKLKIKDVSQKYYGQTQHSTDTHALESLGNIFLTESLSMGYNTQITSEPTELDRQCPNTTRARYSTYVMGPKRETIDNQ